MKIASKQLVALALLGALQLSGVDCLSPASQAAGAHSQPGDPAAATVGLVIHAPIDDGNESGPIALPEQPINNGAPAINRLGFSHCLQATVTKTCYEHELAVQVENALNAALKKDPDLVTLRHDNAKYAKLTNRLANRAKDALGDVLTTGGFGPSKQAARIMLDKQKVTHDTAAVDLQLQKAIDKLHPKIVESILEIAMGVGETDQVRGKEIAQKGWRSLAYLTGQDEATAILTVLQNWNLDLQQHQSARAKSWDIHTFQRNVSCATEAAIEEDPVIVGLTQRLEKFRKPGLAKENISRVLEAAFSAVSWLGPGIGIPAAAELARMLVVACTGGSEEDKMIKELYLDKRLQSRCGAITSEMQMSMTGYQMGVLQKNSLLCHSSRAIIGELVADEKISTEIRRREEKQGGSEAKEHDEHDRLQQTAAISTPQ